MSDYAWQLGARLVSVLTVAAFFGLAAACAPGLDARMLLVQAQTESALNTMAVKHNKNGSTDYGLMQINSSNFALLGLRSVAEAMDPCRNLTAAADLYRTLSRYNTGSPTKGITNGYAPAIQARMHGLVVPFIPEVSSALICAEPDPTGWHTVARLRECQQPDDWHTLLQDKEKP